VGVPHRGLVSTAWAINMLHALSPYLAHIRLFTIQGHPIDVSRNVLVEHALASGAEYIYFLDSDVYTEPDTLQRLRSHGLPIVTALYLDRDVDSASFIFTRTAAGNFNTVWKSFTFGVKATGVDSGSFFIGDMHTNVGGTSDNRILIDTTGNVGIGTTTPSERLHVAGNVKATGFITGDITFANGVRATEEADGLTFLNAQGRKIAVLDSEGNLRISGRLVQEA